MPFIRANFQPIGGQSRKSRTGTAETVPGAPQMFSYRTADAHAAVDTSGYFAAVADNLEVGDLIYVMVIDGNGAMQTAGFHVVRTKAAGVVDVTNVLAATMTNTD